MEFKIQRSSAGFGIHKTGRYGQATLHARHQFQRRMSQANPPGWAKICVQFMPALLITPISPKQCNDRLNRFAFREWFYATSPKVMGVHTARMVNNWEADS